MSAREPARVLTVGETMALLDPLEQGQIELGSRFELRIAGAESNFAVALARLGVDVEWVSRLGDDRLGQLVLDALGAEGLDLDHVVRDPERSTGLFIKWRAAGKTSVVYYRAAAAATALEPSDVPDEALDGVGLVHLTGITMALGEAARRLVLDLARRAHERGIAVIFDPNYRAALWGSPAHAGAVQRAVLPFPDWYLCGLEEGNALWGTGGAEALLEAHRRAGVRGSVVRLGERGALVSTPEGVREVAPPRREEVLDEVGAGDGFAAGFAFGLLRGWPPESCTRAGHVIAAAALRGTGDWETFPRLDEVRAELESAAPAPR